MSKILLSGFKILNYEDIGNSGWIEVEDITTIIGNNENRKLNMLKAVWAMNDFSENNNKNVLDQEKSDEEDKIFVSVRYKMPEDLRKELSERVNIDERYVKDTIDMNKFSSGKYSVCNFIEENQWISDRFSEWINLSEKKLSKNILKIVKKYHKDFEKEDTFSNNMIQENVNSFFEKLDALNNTKTENKAIKKLKDTITSSYIFNQDCQDIKSIVIQNMPKFILCEESDSADELAVNGEKLSLNEFYVRAKNGFYEEGDKDIILLMHNFEKKSILKTDLDFIDYYKDIFNDIQCIHTTVAPFLINETNKNRCVINSDRKFKKEVCVKQETSFKNYVFAMCVGALLWISITIKLFINVFQDKKINYSEKNWIIIFEQIGRLTI